VHRDETIKCVGEAACSSREKETDSGSVTDGEPLIVESKVLPVYNSLEL